mmetsp:Transcript_8064/g.15004  ORF Transcript_8064/g.15004 Transcript_8064/m.15004 type:complete len:266 (-) Transcript_8064:65-862(-)
MVLGRVAATPLTSNPLISVFVSDRTRRRRQRGPFSSALPTTSGSRPNHFARAAAAAHKDDADVDGASDVHVFSNFETTKGTRRSAMRHFVSVLASVAALGVCGGDEAFAAERGLKRYIRRKDTTDIQAYITDVVQAKELFGGFISEAVKSKDFEGASKSIHSDALKTFRSSVRGIITSKNADKEESFAVLQSVFGSLEHVDRLIVKSINLVDKANSEKEEGKKGEEKAKKAEEELTQLQEDIVQAISDFQTATQTLIETQTTVSV